jgi:hypothetical protein
MMIPFLAGLGAKEWFHEHATALMWTAALGVAALIAFWDRRSAKPKEDLKPLHPLQTTEQRFDNDPIFHPSLEKLGRRIEAAVLGGKDGEGRKIVTTKLLSLVNQGKTEIPANQYELCDGKDPAEGKQKFLTVTLTDTVRQEDTWKVPHQWLGTIPQQLDMPTKVIGDFNCLTWAQKIALARVSEYGNVGRNSLRVSLSDRGFGKDVEETMINPLLKAGLIEEDGQGILEVKTGREGFVKYLLAKEPLY